MVKNWSTIYKNLCKKNNNQIGFCGKETEYLAGVGWFWGWGWGKWSSMADFKGKCGTT